MSLSKAAAERDLYRLWDLQTAVPKNAPPAYPHPRTSPALALALELQTTRALSRLRQKLAELVMEAGLRAKVRPLTLERWHAAALHEETATPKKGGGGGAHPVLPVATMLGGARAGLADDLVRQGLAKETAATVSEAFAAEAANLCVHATTLMHRAISGLSMVAPPLSIKFNRHTVDLACKRGGKDGKAEKTGKAERVETGHAGENLIKLSRDVYGKLAVLHRRHAPESERNPPLPSPGAGQDPDEEEREAAAAAAATASGAVDETRTAFHQRLYAMLLRYQSVRAPGYQAALGKPVWAVLCASLGVGVEGCASPLNCFLPAYGSAFPDVDGPFGSRGSFLRFKPLAGSYAVHPPPVPAILDATAEHVLATLAASAAAPGGQHALSFVIVLPDGAGAKEGRAHQSLSNSPFLRATIRLSAAEHGYADGAAHKRSDPYHQALADAAVLVLQTEKGARKWAADTSPLQAKLRFAFGACLPPPNKPAAPPKKARPFSQKMASEEGGTATAWTRGQEGVEGVKAPRSAQPRQSAKAAGKVDPRDERTKKRKLAACAERHAVKTEVKAGKREEYESGQAAVAGGGGGGADSAKAPRAKKTKPGKAEREAKRVERETAAAAK